MTGLLPSPGCFEFRIAAVLLAGTFVLHLCLQWSSLQPSGGSAAAGGFQTWFEGDKKILSIPYGIAVALVVYGLLKTVGS